MNDLSSQLQVASDSDLHERTVLIARKEQQTTLELLYHLHEVNRRRLYAQKGYASLWEYTVQALSYSESQASERLCAMRLMFRTPEVQKAMEAGKLGLTQAAMAERHIRTEEKENRRPASSEKVLELVSQVEGKSKRETEKVLVTLRPKEPIRERLRPITGDLSEVRLSISDATQKAIERYWNLKGRSSISELFSTCLEFFLTHKESDSRQEKTKPSRDNRGPEKVSSLSSLSSNQGPGLFPEKVANQNRKIRSRYIPASIRREVRQRSEGKCEYVDPESHKRCESRHLLQFDHVYPYALGGKAEKANLRILCAVHNQYLAGTLFGTGWARPVATVV